MVTAIETGMAQKTDEEQLEWAAANSRVVYSFNRGDFYGLHTAWLKAGRSHSGIILSRQGLSVGEQMRRLLRLIAAKTTEDMQNHVEFLSAGLIPSSIVRRPVAISLSAFALTSDL